jgi:hypothetical protein
MGLRPSRNLTLAQVVNRSPLPEKGVKIKDRKRSPYPMFVSWSGISQISLSFTTPRRKKGSA